MQLLSKRWSTEYNQIHACSGKCRELLFLCVKLPHTKVRLKSADMSSECLNSDNSLKILANTELVTVSNSGRSFLFVLVIAWLLTSLVFVVFRILFLVFAHTPLLCLYLSFLRCILKVYATFCSDNSERITKIGWKLYNQLCLSCRFFCIKIYIVSDFGINVHFDRPILS